MGGIPGGLSGLGPGPVPVGTGLPPLGVGSSAVLASLGAIGGILNPTQARQAKRIYCGNIPSNYNDVCIFFLGERGEEGVFILTIFFFFLKFSFLLFLFFFYSEEWQNLCTHLWSLLVLFLRSLWLFLSKRVLKQAVMGVLLLFKSIMKRFF